MPGGGGLGNAAERDPALVAEDLRDGFISKERAEGLQGRGVRRFVGRRHGDERVAARMKVQIG